METDKGKPWKDKMDEGEFQLLVIQALEILLGETPLGGDEKAKKGMEIYKELSAAKSELLSYFPKQLKS